MDKGVIAWQYHMKKVAAKRKAAKKAARKTRKAQRRA